MNLVITLAAQEVNTFKKLVLTPITHPRMGGSLNRNCIVDVPDPFSRPHTKEKKRSGYARLRSDASSYRDSYAIIYTQNLKHK